MYKRQIYKTKRLVLRPLTLRDYERWCQASDDALPKQNKFDLPPRSLAQRKYSLFKKNVIRHRRIANNDQTYIWNLFLRETKQLIGWIDISTICRDPHQSANLGYFLLNNHRRQGYTREALGKLIPMAFRDLGFHRLEAVMDLDNRAAIQLARKCGLYREGIKKHYWFQNGRWEDQMVYVATPELWG